MRLTNLKIGRMLGTAALFLACALGAGAEPARYRLAVLPFGDGRYPAENQSLGTIVEYSLVELNRFELVDRKNLDRILSEQEFSLGDVASLKTQLRVGELVSARYMISGSVLDVLKEYDPKSRLYSVQLKAAFRILDLETGSYKDSLAISEIGVSQADYKAAASESFEKAAAAVKSKIRAVFPIDGGSMSVVSRLDGFYIVNVGAEAGVDRGNAFFVLPASDGRRGEFEQPRGKLVVLEVGRTSAKCRLVSGKADEGDAVREDTAYRHRGFGAYAAVDAALLGTEGPGARNIGVGVLYNSFGSPLLVDSRIALRAFDRPLFVEFDVSFGYLIGTPVPEFSVFPFVGGFLGIAVQDIPGSYLDELREEYPGCGGQATGVSAGAHLGAGCLLRMGESLAFTAKGRYALASAVTRWQSPKDEDAESSDRVDLDADRLDYPSFTPDGLSVELGVAVFF